MVWILCCNWSHFSASFNANTMWSLILLAATCVQVCSLEIILKVFLFFVVLFSCWTNNSWAVTRGEPGCALNEDTIIFKNTKNGFAYGTFGHWKRSCLSDLFDAFLIGLPCSRVDRPYQQLFIFSHASLHNLLFRFKLCVKSVRMTFEAVECEAFARTWQT